MTKKIEIRDYHASEFFEGGAFHNAEISPGILVAGSLTGYTVFHGGDFIHERSPRPA